MSSAIKQGPAICTRCRYHKAYYFEMGGMVRYCTIDRPQHGPRDPISGGVEVEEYPECKTRNADGNCPDWRPVTLWQRFCDYGDRPICHRGRW